MTIGFMTIDIVLVDEEAFLSGSSQSFRFLELPHRLKDFVVWKSLMCGWL